ncbi:unnamed protein product, partial [Tetraodon nigroviridis]
TPKKGREVGSVDPWTPTSNLKMLISAASPDIRNREKELGLDASGRGCVDSAQDPEPGEDSERWISRKEKSLGLLCRKFLARYPDYPNPARNNDICLDDVAIELNVERRRIYDIMNVLESLHIVSRSAKNRYAWHGRTKLAETLAILKEVGEEHRYSQQMQQIRQRLREEERDYEEEEEEEKENVEQEVEDREQGQKELFFVELPGVEFKAASVNSRKDKSLRVMSQKFVMLFLVSNPRVVSLDVAAKILIGEDHGADRDKNKFKTADLKGCAPEGPPRNRAVLEPRAIKDNCAKQLFSSPGTKRSFTRHPSLIKLAKSIQEDRRKINSAPSSPAKSSLGETSSVDFPNKMAQLAAICKIELDQEEAAAAHPAPRAPLAVLPAGSVAYIPAHCPSLIPVLLPQQQGGAPYAIYLPSPPAKPHPLARPQPTSFAVRSMTFEDRAGQSPGARAEARRADLSPLVQKRVGPEPACESSPPKARRSGSAKDCSAMPSEVPQPRPKSCRGAHPSSRPPPRALHLDPEFINTPGGAGANQGLEQSLESFLDREDRAPSDGELGLTPVRVVPLTPGRIHAETLVPAGYYIPIPHQVVSDKEIPDLAKDTKASTPTYNIYQTPTAGKDAAAARTLGVGSGRRAVLTSLALTSRVQTVSGPGDDTHQHPPPQTRLRCRLATRRPQGPAPPQPQPGHPQLHPAEPGSDLRLRSGRRIRRFPDSGASRRSGQPAESAAKRRGFRQARVPGASSAVRTSGPDQRSAASHDHPQGGGAPPAQLLPHPGAPLPSGCRGTRRRARGHQNCLHPSAEAARVHGRALRRTLTCWGGFQVLGELV